MPVNTTLVLGAGSSCHMGYPVGAKLRKDILQLNPGVLAGSTGSATDARAFLAEFGASYAFSIDTFLARRAEFSDIGRRAIAHVLLQYELESARAPLREIAGVGDWYQYLVNVLACEDWQYLDLSWLTIVTFNYDRSLEWVLLRSLKAMYGQSDAAVVEKLHAIRIHHVYGDMGSPWPTADGAAYGSAVDERLIEVTARTAASRLRVIPEGRDDDIQLTRARSAIATASRVVFLGFGFDEVNIRRIGAPDVFVRQVEVVPIFATCKGMTKAEVRQAARRLLGGAKTHSGADIRDAVQCIHFEDADCLGLLRQTLCLS